MSAATIANPVQAVTVIHGHRRETLALIQLLKDGKPGDTKTDSQLESCCGKDTRPGGDGYAYLQSACRRVRKDYGLVWKRVPGSGVLKCLNATECVREVDGHRKSLHRKTGRMLEVAAIADSGALPDQDRAELRSLTAQVAVLREFSSKSATKAVSANGIQSSVVNMPKLLEALRK